jgi:hypothetical protein
MLPAIGNDYLGAIRALGTAQTRDPAASVMVVGGG